MLTYLQTSAPPVDGAVFTAAATIWSNSAQSLIVAVLQSSDVVLYRRNVVTGLVDSPSRLVPPGAGGAGGDATIFSGQGPALSVATAGGTVFVTTLGALQLPSAVLLELETNNFVVPTPGGTPVANATEDELWAARWGIDWEPAFRLQLRMEGSKMDGAYISYRPDLSSATYSASTLSSCAGKVEVPVAFERQIPSSSADACLVGSSPIQGSSILCSSSLVMEGGFCSTYQKFQNMEVANGGVKILAAQDTSLSAIDAADPGRTDRFDLPPPLDTSSPDASHFWGDANNENHLLALHVNAQDAAVLREFMLGCDGGPLSSCSEAGAYLALAPFPSSDTVPLTNHSDESDALWRMVSATRWLNERIGLRQFLPENERGSILPFPTTNIPVVDEAIGINVVKPNPCNSWLPGVWCEGSHIVSISWVGWAGSLSDGTVPDLFAGLPYLQSFRLVDSPIRGVLPSSFCNLRRLRYFHIERSGLSGLPDCFGPEHMPTLRHFHVSEANVQQMPPSLARAEKLTWLNFAHNKPADGAAVDSAASSIIDVPDLSTLRSLVVLNISSSSLRAPLSNFRCTSWSSLHIYALDGNRLTGSLPSHWFNGNSQLRQVSLSDNSGISGTFPSLFTATSLLSLSLSGCGLSGSLPASWSQLTLLQSLDVSGNKLTLPISSLSGCTSLLYADLSSNGVDCPADGLLDSLLSHLPVSLQTLRLDHNPLRGCRWQSAVGSLRSSSLLLQALTASHTGITQLPEDLFEPSLPWRALDFSYCQLTVGVSDRYVPSSQLLSFSIKGNPALDGFAVLGRTKPRSATQCGAAASTRVGEEASVLRALR
jgi:Leucine-rich repeat (LRR) protein